MHSRMWPTSRSSRTTRFGREYGRRALLGKGRQVWHAPRCASRYRARHRGLLAVGGSSRHGGYGQFNHGTAHAWIGRQIHGQQSEGILFMHRCDTRRCVRPDHVVPGTQRENIKDMYAKGRGVIRRGEAHAQSKVSQSRAEEIRRLAKTMKQSEVARRFQLSNATISRVVNNPRWGEP